ncbi:MAG TPA: papain-like cysteine protease family protein [Thermoanaerobaculia bacterium]
MHRSDPSSPRGGQPQGAGSRRAAALLVALLVAAMAAVAVAQPRPAPTTTLRAEAVEKALVFNPPALISLGAGDQLAVPLYGQETNVWCWDASSLMVIKYFKPTSPLRQCDLATQATPGQSCCASPRPAACVHTGWEMLSTNGFALSSAGSAIGWNDLKAQISTKKKPVLFAWGWNGGGGHMLVADGWFSLAGSQFVRVNNPWPPGSGAKESYTYAAWVGGPGYDHITWANWYDITPKLRVPILKFLPFEAFKIEHPPGPDPLRGKLTVHPDVVRHATTTLEAIRSAPEALAPHLGFRSAGEAKQAQLGTPLREYNVHLDALRGYTAQAPAEKLLRGGTTLFYPVVANGAIRSSVRIAHPEGKAPETLSIGDTGVSSHLDRLQAIAPQLRQAGGDSVPAVRVPALGLYFVARKSGETLEVASLFDVPNLGLKAGAFESAAAVFARLVPVAKALPDGAM